MRRVGLVTGALLAIAGAAFAQELDLGLVHLGENASFVDFKGLRTTNGVANFRALVVAKTGQPLVGGWRHMSIDCQANELRTLEVAPVKADGAVGPDEPLSGQIFPIAEGSAEDAMAAAVCDKAPVKVRAPNILEATTLGRARLAQAAR